MEELGREHQKLIRDLYTLQESIQVFTFLISDNFLEWAEVKKAEISSFFSINDLQYH